MVEVPVCSPQTWAHCTTLLPGKVSLETPAQVVAQATLGVWLALGHAGTIQLKHLVQHSESVCGEVRAGVSAALGAISSSLTPPGMGLPKPFWIGGL